MRKPQRHRPSQMFTLQLWREELSDSQSEWRGRVHHVASGATRYFRDWPTLVVFLLAPMGGPDDDHADATG